ncbi:ATP-dependent zinc metalloprotease FtsH [Leadbettera azotonutricia]|uniref:ATP-dependent zinc metalloprotease FtsH n=1 Tax=Leadbettera azotonutricia (strain ATCC BAA-888 / DSM 13862 / ZAS-9) TaxID=545695 RepID=F5YD67_LEAAZ|nr:ATP-dependent zinc metalloprotease FtsH [Leadbettera azotonutricia]AEF80134.1 cell division protease FtsH [Leadbettera azotonutricia ZAS-9]
MAEYGSEDPQEDKPKQKNTGPQFPFGGGGGPKLPDFKPFGGWKFSIIYVVILIIGLSLFNFVFLNRVNPTIDFSEFKAKITTGEIKRVEITDSYFTGYSSLARKETNQSPMFRTPYTPVPEAVYRTVPINDPDLIKLMDEKNVAYYAVSREGSTVLNIIFSWVLPIAFFIFIWRFLMKRIGNMGGNVLSVGQNKAIIVAEGDVKTRFIDVAGVDEAKEELVEVVDFLKAPKKYTDIGGKIPKGVLLVGPPGTGKTLLARAVAGEAGVSFFRISGAEFVEMFVGVGAARVRDLFKQAREKGRCIIFIDELDAIGKSRINNIAGGNDEREQTLNQLLVEMDGFDATAGLIILAATNRPDVLDPALLRPGRFDRQVLVDRPDLIGREAILRIHSKTVKLSPEVDLASVARGTSGFVGADLANIVNEAALLAVRAGRQVVMQADFGEAIEKTVAGLQKKTRVIKPEERRIVAYHETGHALIAAFTPNSDPVQKISIVPRGFGALGYTLQMPVEDRYLMTEAELLGKIDVLLGGRAAEELIFGEISTGAANDLTRATDIARKMITEYGMSSRFKNVALTQRGTGMMGNPIQEPSFQREYSEATQQYIDEEIAHNVEKQYGAVKIKLEQNRPLLEKVAALLLEKETLDEKEFKELVKGD